MKVFVGLGAAAATGAVRGTPAVPGRDVEETAPPTLSEGFSRTMSKRFRYLS